MAPVVSEVAVIPEHEIVDETAAERDLPRSAAEEAHAVSTSEPETSLTIEGTLAHRSLFAETGSPDDERNAVKQSETIEPEATEAENMSSPAEDKIDVADDKTSDSAPILAAAEQLPEVASQEIIQPQSTTELGTDDVLDNREITNLSTELEEHDAEENIEANEDDVVEEVI